MVAKWTEMTLAELGPIATGKTPSTAIPANFGGAIPFITPGDMDGRRFIASTTRCLTENGAASVTGARIPAGAVLVSCIGSDMGKAAIAAMPSVTNQQINSVVVQPPNSNLFVYYDLSRRKDEIRLAAGGSAQPILNKSAFGRLPIVLPDPKIQRAIAHILGTLDDEIELNRRMNETLEAMARALFKSWFVDFDPVRSRAEGRQPSGMDTETAKLFPSEFAESELGEIPKGWRVTKLEEWVTLQRGTTYKSGLLGMTGPYLLGLASIRRDGGFRADSLRRYSGDSPDKLLLKHGDLYVSLKDVTQSGDLLGSIARVPGWLGQGRLTQDTVRLDFSEDRWRNYRQIYTYWLLRAPEYREYCRARAIGTTNLSLSRDDFLSFQVVVPPPETLARLTGVLASLTSRIEDLEESRTLAHVRDALLPRLLSGELPVRNAARLVEAHA